MTHGLGVGGQFIEVRLQGGGRRLAVRLDLWHSVSEPSNIAQQPPGLFAELLCVVDRCGACLLVYGRCASVHISTWEAPCSPAREGASTHRFATSSNNPRASRCTCVPNLKDVAASRSRIPHRAFPRDSTQHPANTLSIRANTSPQLSSRATIRGCKGGGTSESSRRSSRTNFRSANSRVRAARSICAARTLRIKLVIVDEAEATVFSRSITASGSVFEAVGFMVKGFCAFLVGLCVRRSLCCASWLVSGEPFAGTSLAGSGGRLVGCKLCALVGQLLGGMADRT